MSGDPFTWSASSRRYRGVLDPQTLKLLDADGRS